MKAFDLAMSSIWAITEDSLANILNIAARENDTIEAIEARLGKPLEDTHATTIRDGVATVPLVGPIFRRANLMTKHSGATSNEVVARDFQAALDNPQVKSIILAVDSPGGEVNGTHELSQLVKSARGKKPIVAHVSGSGASGAYWIASAADEIVVSKTAGVGSIGCVMATRNAKDPNSVQFVSSVSPNKRPDLDTKEGRAQYQDQVDAIAGVFVGEIAENLGVKRNKVLQDFGKGGILIGQGAVDAGMAHRVLTHEALHAEMADRAYARKPKPRLAASSGSVTMNDSFFARIGRSIMGVEAQVSGDDDGDRDTPVGNSPAPPIFNMPKITPSSNPANFGPSASAITADLAAARADNEKIRTFAFGQIDASARAFANEQVALGKIDPAQRAHLEAEYIAAARDDFQHPFAAPISVTAADGSTLTFQSRTDLLRDAKAKAPAHGRTEEVAATTITALAPNVQQVKSEFKQGEDMGKNFVN